MHACICVLSSFVDRDFAGDEARVPESLLFVQKEINEKTVAALA